jgi:hypothetical protein
MTRPSSQPFDSRQRDLAPNRVASATGKGTFDQAQQQNVHSKLIRRAPLT